ATTSEGDANQDLSALLSDESTTDAPGAGSRKKRSNSGASSIPSGVRLENISKSYKGVTVLKDVSWEVQRGEKVGLVGVNGAGKTTLFKMITGDEKPDAGELRLGPTERLAYVDQDRARHDTS
ncbi:ATP-binding cassette domain-containing protein, partial [Escherichia coli]|nr:ATP-binding cassette domain-containing protein [Escherichia coli]